MNSGLYLLNQMSLLSSTKNLKTVLLLISMFWTAARGHAETEPNNSSSQANGLAIGLPMTGQLANTADLDWFSLSVAQATTINVSFDSPQNLSSPSWEYHLIRCEDSVGTILMTVGTASDTAVTVYLPMAGTYRLVVGKGSNTLTTAQYSLTVTPAFTVAEHEPNNLISAATPIQPTQPIHGQLSSTTDVDWFQFSAGAPGVVSFAFDSPANLSSPSWEYHIITIMNGSGVVFSSMGTASDITFDVTLPTSGTYYASVAKGKDQLHSQPYKLTLASTTGTTPATPLSATIQPAVEIAWTSKVGKSYTVQWSVNVAGPWQQMAGPLPGSGARMNFFDSTALSTRRFYRVIEQ
jgi:hypothetical protein